MKVPRTRTPRRKEVGSIEKLVFPMSATKPTACPNKTNPKGRNNVRSVLVGTLPETPECALPSVFKPRNETGASCPHAISAFHLTMHLSSGTFLPRFAANHCTGQVLSTGRCLTFRYLSQVS